MAKYLTIGQLSKQTGVDIRTIRHYDSVGVFKPADLSEAGYRLYSEAQVWQLKLIRSLRETGFSLKDIKQLLAGKRSIDKAIDLQLELIKTQQVRLEQSRVILERARKAGEAEKLECLTESGLILRLSLSEKQAFLKRKMASLIAEEASVEWRKVLMNLFFDDLPDQLNQRQVDAWVELVDLLENKSIQAEAKMQISSFWKTMKMNHLDPQVWSSAMQDIMDGALAAHKNQAAPQDKDVQDLVETWAGLFANASNKDLDDAFYRYFGDLAPNFLNKSNIRIQELIQVLTNKEPDAILEAQILLLRGLEYRLTQLIPSPADAVND